MAEDKTITKKWNMWMTLCSRIHFNQMFVSTITHLTELNQYDITHPLVAQGFILDNYEAYRGNAEQFKKPQETHWLDGSTLQEIDKQLERANTDLFYEIN